VLKKEPEVREFSESVGHTLSEVVAGVILGIAVSVIMSLC
jgi:acid phosphatase family membrane protein YuiD